MDNTQELVSIEGTVERIRFTNSENGYTVLDLVTEDGELVTVVGILPFLSNGEMICVSGNWTTHPTFGEQLKAETYEKLLPNTASAILKYLSSGIVKGIGPKTASRIVDRFGLDSFDVIENHPDWLSDIQGITSKKAREISRLFREKTEIRNVMMFFKDYFGPSLTVKILREFGPEAVEIVKANPYVLCERIEGISFDKADQIARDQGVDKNSKERISAGIQFVLDYNSFENGHCFIPYEKLLPTCNKLLGCGLALLDEVLTEKIQEGVFVRTDIHGKDAIYTKDMYDKEQYIFKKLRILEDVTHVVDTQNLDGLIRKAELDGGLEYERMQIRAIKGAVTSSVFILTGGPGTGKTTVVRGIIKVFDDMGLRVSLCAPTGRAAKRMSQAATKEAKTIHRLLEYQYDPDGEMKFFINENNKLDSDVVIIDETSMVDIDIMYALLKALKNSCRLVLIGDANQLPPVGSGYVFRDMIDSSVFHMVALTHIFRQAEESYIVVNAHAINRGEYLDLDHKDSDFFFLRRNTDSDTIATIVDLVKNRLPKRYGYTIYDGIQIISPSRKGEVGTENLNVSLQLAINPPAPGKTEKKILNTVFREGDKVMQVKNNYDISWEKYGVEGNGIYNGDIGIIKQIDLKNESVIIDFEEKIAMYDYEMLQELELAYAVTVHKSQGSEYPIVIFPLYRYTPKLLTRNLLYTAVTRAQNMMILVGNEDVSKAMVDNNTKTIRYTGLRYSLEKDFDES